MPTVQVKSYNYYNEKQEKNAGKKNLKKEILK